MTRDEILRKLAEKFRPEAQGDIEAASQYCVLRDKDTNFLTLLTFGAIADALTENTTCKNCGQEIERCPIYKCPHKGWVHAAYNSHYCKKNERFFQAGACKDNPDLAEPV